jgi:hypothetical protein
VIVIFCRSHTVPSVAVRTATWSKYSHVVLLAPDGVTTYEAVWPRVRKADIQTVRRENGIIKLVDLPCQDPDAAIAWAASQVGKPYDLTALLGFLAHHDMASEGAWFCSEYVTMAFHHGGTDLFRLEDVDRIVPQHLWMLPGTVLSDDWVEDCLLFWGRILTGKRAHWCWEFDGLPVDETCHPHIDCCTCFPQEESA